MDLNRKTRSLKYWTLAAGFLGCMLYIIIFTAGLDRRGLPAATHWSHIGLWCLTALLTILVFFASRSFSAAADYQSAYPSSIFSAAGCLAAAAGFFAFGTPMPMAGALRSVDLILRLAAGAALCILAYCRYAGQKPFFLLHSLVCLSLAFRMVNLYRFWSADPQLTQYFFYLAAYLALMLTGYHLAAFDVGCGSHRKLWFFGLTAVYLCIVSQSGPGGQFFLLGCALWVLTNLSCPVSSQAEEN